MIFIRRFTARLASLALLAGAIGLPTSSHAGAIAADSFLQFAFSDVGVAATGCNPADPGGGFCIPSSGTPTTFLDAPPWTYTAPAVGAILTVTDSFLSGDRFEVFDHGASLGLTSAPLAGADCGDDPAICLTTAGISKGSFVLGAGQHSLSIVAALSEGGGSGYLQIAAVPEPNSALLLGIGGLAIAWAIQRRRLSVSSWV